jgi:digeranylgeranylglycerophospholipid reductase
LADKQIHDVVVIGAGPVGCYTAYGLSRKGLEVLVVEKENTPKSTPICTGVIGVEAFDEFDLPRSSILATVRDVHLYSPSGKTIVYRPSLPQAYAVDRATFDEELKRMAEDAGAVFCDDMTCKDIRIAYDCVELTTNRSPEPLRAKCLVLAAGYNPGLALRLGLGRITDHFEGVQTEAEVADLTATEIYLGHSVAPLSFAWMLPIGGTKARIGLTTRRNGPTFLGRFLESSAVRGRLQTAGAISRKLIPYGQLKRSYTERTLVVGEAAGQVKSTTHGGIYYGLIGARCAIETIGNAFQTGDFGASALSDYERRWREILEREIDRGFLLRRFFSRLSDRHMDKLFELTSKDGIMAAVHEKARFDWHQGIISSLVEHPLLKRHFHNVQ